MKNEADVIKILAALTAAPRWVTALVQADGARFLWADSQWWSVLSAVLSVGFAAVEVYAAAYIMRAWRQARPGSQAERGLLGLWLGTLLALVTVMTPPIYANVTSARFASLPGWLLVVWSVAVAASTFLIIGGVGYAERRPVADAAGNASGNLPAIKVEPAAPLPASLPLAANTPQLAAPERQTRAWRDLTPAERAELAGMENDAVMARWHVSERTARNWRRAAAESGK